MEKKTTEFVYIIDRSRSMHGKEKEIIDRFNHWLTQQKQKKSPFLVTLALCNEECELLYCRMPLKYVKPLDTFAYYTKGYSAYLDSAEEVLDLLSKLMPQEEKSRQDVSLYLITDGLDNVSSEEERERFKEKIQRLKERGWKIALWDHRRQNYN